MKPKSPVAVCSLVPCSARMFLYGAGLEEDEATAAQWASAAANSGLQDIIFTYFYTVTRSG